jgi:hypothetical protein
VDAAALIASTGSAIAPQQAHKWPNRASEGIERRRGEPTLFASSTSESLRTFAEDSDGIARPLVLQRQPRGLAVKA